MRPGAEADPVTLSVAEFDVLCEAANLADRRHIVLDVPSPGATFTERARIVADVWAGLRARHLAEPGGDRVDAELGDLLALLDRPRRSIDVRIWADRPIRALAATADGEGALLSIVDGDAVELTPVRASSLAEAAVSVAGDVAAGPGRAVSLPNEVLREASDAAGPNDPHGFVDELRELGVPADDAAEVVRMSDGMGVRGQFGAEFRPQRGGHADRAPRVVGFHDTPAGRYLHVVRTSGDGRRWSTLAPADNQRIAEYVRELLTELADGELASPFGV
ncbi:ESX secretion-associated protein EspG [Saccharopolyspora rosea]|uniref:ESX secretion-associated protein EspG n=1 Tax=Saccharopolyspora rosea TaxID=524884 RepID=A0ABW3FZ75_9PSEU|nr:ESX secretion-associated protein EspG [Saccharopolyspora rosea]